MAELWEFQEKPPYHFVSAQLFASSTRQLLPFLFYFESSPLLLGASKYSVDEVSYDKSVNARSALFAKQERDAIQNSRRYWKVRIGRVNGKDCTEKIQLNEEDEEYKEAIELETGKLIRIIEKTSKSQVNTIKAIFVIDNGSRAWLLGCEDLILESTKFFKRKAISKNLERIELATKQERLLRRHLQQYQKLNKNLNTSCIKKFKLSTPKSPLSFWTRGKSEDRTKQLPSLVIKSSVPGSTPYRYKSRVEVAPKELFRGQCKSSKRIASNKLVSPSRPEVKKVCAFKKVNGNDLCDYSVQSIFFGISAMGKTQKLSGTTLAPKHAKAANREPAESDFKEAELGELRKINGQLHKLKELVRTRFPKPKFNIVIKQTKDS